MQRARLLAATAQVACERGATNVTVAHIVERAGVSRRTFYEIFADADDCVAAAFQDALDQAQACVLDAWRSDGSWRERLRRALIELLCLFDDERVLAGLLIVESLGAGSEVLEQRACVVQAIVDALYGHACGSEARSTRLAAEGAVGGVLGILHSRISQRSADPLLDLTAALMSLLVFPSLGAAAARRELDRPVRAPEKARGSGEPLRSDPFKDAGMRLTYRTMRVLSAISQQPGTSNRQVGELAEMSDQGQISKLLARLERIGVIVNTSDGQPGEANAWVLTAVGRQVIGRVGAHEEAQSA
jgi:AcrR family transcriptional regulator